MGFVAVAFFELACTTTLLIVAVHRAVLMFFTPLGRSVLITSAELRSTDARWLLRFAAFVTAFGIAICAVMVTGAMLDVAAALRFTQR